MIRAVACAAVLALAPSAQAADADRLLDLLGYDAYAVFWENNYRDPGGEMLPEEASDWRRAAADLFAADDLKGAAAAGLEGLPEDARVEIAEFLDSPAGRRVTEAEVEAQDIARQDEIEAAVDDVNLANIPPARTELFEALQEGFGLVEDWAAGQMNFQLAYAAGMAETAPDTTVDLDTLALMLSEELPQIEAELEDEAARWTAYVYDPLSDADLEAYGAFLSSEAGVALYDVLDRVEQLLAERDAQELGRRMGALASEQEL